MGGLSSVGSTIRGDEGRRLFRYLLIGGLNTLLAYGIYVLGLLAGLRFELASLAALLVGVVVSFVAQGRLVFAAKLHGKFLPFAATWLVLYLANITLIGLLHWAGLDYYFAGLAAAVPVTATAYLMQRFVIFVDQPVVSWDRFLIILTLLLVVARLDLALRFEANWDEFLNLAMVHAYSRGDLHQVLQTAFVHLFRWVPGVAVNEVDQVVAARLLVLLFAVGISAAIYVAARQFMDWRAALFAALSYNAFSFVMRNGNALRTDPLATACMMAAAALALIRDFRPRHAIGVGITVGLAGALTIKAFFYVPVIGALLLIQAWYSPDRKWGLALALLAGITALGSFSLVLLLHGSGFDATASTTAFVSRTSGATVFSGDYAIFLESFDQALRQNLPFWILLVVGVAGAIEFVRTPLRRREGFLLLSFTLVLASPLVYRDVYPYYYPFMLAPASVLAGFGFFRLSRLRRGIYAKGAVVLVFAFAAVTYWQSRLQDNGGQRTVLAVIHQLFPQPVPYIDHTSMVSAFPQRGFFMSRWGVADYRRTNRPIMAEIIARDEPRFLLVTRYLLDVAKIDPEESESRPYGLLAADVRALQANYLRYWGPLYLPGLTIDRDTTRAVQIPGDYRLTSRSPVLIDGRPVMPGAIVRLSKGSHGFSVGERATLRWLAPPPPRARPPRLLFRGF